MDFVTYLTSKNIDAEKFKTDDASTYFVWENEFQQMHVNSFTSQKLFTINQIRLKYQLHKGAKPKPVKVVEVKPENVDLKTDNLSADIPKVSKPVFKKPMVDPQTSEVSEEPKKVVSKPVFKRPTPPNTTETDKTEADNLNEISASDKTETLPESQAVKKPAFKPVFKRPDKSNETE